MNKRTTNLITFLTAIYEGDHKVAESLVNNYKEHGLCACIYGIDSSESTLNSIFTWILEWDENMSNSTFFPVDFDRDTLGKKYYWEALAKQNMYTGAYGCKRRRLAKYLSDKLTEEFKGE